MAIWRSMSMDGAVFIAGPCCIGRTTHGSRVAALQAGSGEIVLVAPKRVAARGTRRPRFGFLGRRVYVGLIVVLVSALGHGLTPGRMRVLRESLGIDDWNWQHIKPATLRAIARSGLIQEFAVEIPTSGEDAAGYWNGLGIFVLRRSEPVVTVCLVAHSRLGLR